MNKIFYIGCFCLIGCLPTNLDNFKEPKDATVDNDSSDVVDASFDVVSDNNSPDVVDVFDAPIDVVNDNFLVDASFLIDHCIIPNSSYTERFTAEGKCAAVDNAFVLVNKDGTLPFQFSCDVSVDGCYINLTHCDDAGSSWHATFSENGNSATGTEYYNGCVYNFTLSRND